MGSVQLRYLHAYRVRGKKFAYYRRHNKRIRIPGEYGSAEFLAAYKAIDQEFNAKTNPSGSAIPGSFRALVEAYKASREFKNMKPATRDGYLWVLEWLLPKYGDGLVAEMTRDWVFRRRDELADTPGKANYFTTVMSVVLSWGMDRKYCTANVAARIKKYETGESFRAWTDAEIQVFTGEAAGRVALPVLIGLYTGQRLDDVLRMPWSAYDGAMITLKQSKAGKKADTMFIPIHPVLKAALDAAAKTAVTICTRVDGHSWKKRHFGAVFAAKRAKLGLAADVHFHGLRHSSASRMSEAGATDAQVQAITGHKSRQMVEHYTRGARQKELAKSAIALLPAGRIGNKSG